MKKIALATIIAVLTFMACKKSKVEEPAPAPAPTLVGLWKGKYSLTPTTLLNQDVIYYFKADGSMRIYNGTDTATVSQKGVGAWIIITVSGGASGTAVYATYSYFSSPNIDYTIRFTPNKEFINSTEPSFDAWALGNYISNPSNFIVSGKITLTKQ